MRGKGDPLTFDCTPFEGQRRNCQLPTKKCHSSIEPEWCAWESEIGLLSKEQIRPILRD